MKRLPLVALMASAGLMSQTAQAYDFFGDMLRIEGFGTVGAFSSDLDSASVPVTNTNKTVPQVRADIRESHGSVDNKVIWDADSLLSVQATLNPTGKIKGVVQLLSKQDINASQRPQWEWAYGSWQATSNLNLKLGRVVAPIFMLSDTRNVNYTQTMVRPATTVYTMNPITNLDGGSLLWEDRVGGYDYNVEAMYGRTKVIVPTGTVKIPTVYGLASKWSRGEWTTRIGWSHFDLDMELIPSKAALLNGAKKLCTNCPQVINDRIGLVGQHATMYTIGGQWDHDDYQVMAEYAVRTGSTAAVADIEGYYLMGAKRFGAWTPFVSWGRYRNTEPALGVYGPNAPALAQPTADLEDARGFGRATRTETALGVRWDFMPKMSLKGQWGQMRLADPRNGSSPAVEYATPNTNKFNGTVNTYTVNLDFIF